MPERSSSNFWGLFALSAALVLFGLVIGNSLRYRYARGAADTITVTGSAKRPIRSDYAVWGGALSSQRPTLQEGYQEINALNARFRALLRESNLPDSAVTFRPLETSTIQEMKESEKSGREIPTGRILAYVVRQPFEVRSAQIENVSKLADLASRLISEDIRIDSRPLQYLYTRLPELRSQMLSEAAADARRRAESIVSSVGSKIGPVRNARMGVFQITPRNSTEVRDYGIYDTSSLEKDITAVVTITFAVK